MRYLTPRRVTLASFVIFAALAVVRLAAHAIDYVGMNVNPASSMAGGSGNWTVTNAVNGGSAITFDLKYSIVVQGGTTTFPKTIGFGATTEIKPSGAADAVVTGIVSHTFSTASSTFTDAIAITAPTTPGAYSVKVKAVSGTGGSGGLQPGNGITINFTVAE